jgi:hypothetical protein
MADLKKTLRRTGNGAQAPLGASNFQVINWFTEL